MLMHITISLLLTASVGSAIPLSHTWLEHPPKLPHKLKGEMLEDGIPPVYEPDEIIINRI